MWQRDEHPRPTLWNIKRQRENGNANNPQQYLRGRAGGTTQRVLGRLAPDFKQVINRFWERKGSVGILTRLLGDRNHRHDVGGCKGGDILFQYSVYLRGEFFFFGGAYG